MREYACIMLDYEQPEFIKRNPEKDFKRRIILRRTQEDIDTNQYGIEDECHITICFGLENDVRFEDFKQYLFPLEDYKTILINISTFENEKYDVLKVDARCPKAAESNKLINDNFEVHTEFKDFHPHMTIAYLQKGKGKKYTKDILDKIEGMKPYEFNYSYSKDGEDINEFYKNNDLK